LVEPVAQGRLLHGVPVSGPVEKVRRAGDQPLLPLHDLGGMDFKLPGQFVEGAGGFDRLQSDLGLESSAVRFSVSFHRTHLMYQLDL
jgi:hypothetical protein